MYNAISVVIFHFSWKQQSSVWGSAADGRLVYQAGGTFENADNKLQALTLVNNVYDVIISETLRVSSLANASRWLTGARLAEYVSVIS